MLTQLVQQEPLTMLFVAVTLWIILLTPIIGLWVALSMRRSLARIAAALESGAIPAHIPPVAAPVQQPSPADRAPARIGLSAFGR